MYAYPNSASISTVTLLHSVTLARIALQVHASLIGHVSIEILVQALKPQDEAKNVQ